MTFKYDVRDYMKLYPDFLTKKECEETIKLLQEQYWNKHSYADANSGFTNQFENDLSICFGHGVFFDEQTKKIWNYLKEYMDYIDQKTFNTWHGYTRIRYNRYDVGEEMRNHIDHISSMFDGEIKGVPTLSILGSLNDDYEGGKLLFFNDVEVIIPAGSLLIFPSTFMWPHLVTPVTKGTRYSFVSWVW